MRVKVIQLIDDAKLGGVNIALESLAASKLKQEFQFQLIHTRLNLPQFNHYDASVIVIHAAMSWRKLPALLALKIANWSTPILYQEHHYSREFVRHCVANSSRFKWMLKLGYAMVDKVLTVSNPQADWLVDFCQLPEHKIARVGQAKELSSFIAVVKTKRHSPLRLAAYGRLSKQKGFDLLIRAIAHFPDTDVTLTIAGDGEDKEALQQLVAHKSQVSFIGEIEDVAAFLSTVDAVIIPSRWEPFGLTCMESVAAGKHVILPAIDGLADQLPNPDERIGFEVIESLSITGIIEAIEKVSNQNHLGVSESQRVATEQAWENMLERWQQLLAEYK